MAMAGQRTSAATGFTWWWESLAAGLCVGVGSSNSFTHHPVRSCSLSVAFSLFSLLSSGVYESKRKAFIFVSATEQCG